MLPSFLLMYEASWKQMLKQVCISWGSIQDRLGFRYILSGRVISVLCGQPSDCLHLWGLFDLNLLCCVYFVLLYLHKDVISEQCFLHGYELYIFDGTLFWKACEEESCGWCNLIVNLTLSVLLCNYFLTRQVGLQSRFCSHSHLCTWLLQTTLYMSHLHPPSCVDVM